LNIHYQYIKSISYKYKVILTVSVSLKMRICHNYLILHLRLQCLLIFPNIISFNISINATNTKYSLNTVDGDNKERPTAEQPIEVVQLVEDTRTKVAGYDMVRVGRHEAVQRDGSRVHRQDLLRLSKERRLHGGFDRRPEDSGQEQEDHVGDRFEEGAELHDTAIEVEDVRQRDHEDDIVDGSAEHPAYWHGGAAAEVHTVLGGGRLAGHAPEGIAEQSRLLLVSNIKVRCVLEKIWNIAIQLFTFREKVFKWFSNAVVRLGA